MPCRNTLPLLTRSICGELCDGSRRYSHCAGSSLASNLWKRIGPLNSHHNESLSAGSCVPLVPSPTTVQRPSKSGEPLNGGSPSNGGAPSTRTVWVSPGFTPTRILLTCRSPLNTLIV